jgi:cysteine desulfurase
MNDTGRVYLDYAATTPLDPRVLTAMAPFFTEVFGNPSSIHFFGQQAEAALEESRAEFARAFNARPEEIIFTGCGTESDNLALRGAALAQKHKNGANHILISAVEHYAVLHTAQQLMDKFGFELELLPVDEFGRVDPDDVAASIRPDTALVSVIYGNNEIGTINPIAKIGDVCHKHGVLFHTDAVQAAAHLPIDVVRDKVDLMSVGAHKFYGPKGVGALYVHRGVPLLPVLTGGKQETGFRGGTQNVPYIVGMAEALRLSRLEQDSRTARLIELRDHLMSGVIERIPRARVTGHPLQRLPNHASFVFEGVDGNRLLMLLDIAGFACSSGSACKVGRPRPSEVLIALGLSRWALGSLRVTLGKDTTLEQVDAFLDMLPRLVDQVRTSQ